MSDASDPRKHRPRSRLIGVEPVVLPPEFAKTVEALGSEVRDPVDRLRFLRQSVSTVGEVEKTLPAFPKMARPWIYKYAGWRGLSRLPGVASRGARRKAQFKIAMLQICLVVAGSALLLGAGYSTMWLAGSVKATTAPLSVPASNGPIARPAPTLVGLDSTGVKPNSIWRVEQTKSYELFSNGLRVETVDTRDAPQRSYVTFDPVTEEMSEPAQAPVGIVFHTTESDILPLEPENNGSLLRSSQNLIAFVRRHQLYHYLIDRFGRVYRIVPDNARANHAGNSAFESGGRLFLNLNHAFFGVSFESKFSATGPVPLTEAQVQSGRMLTDHLRSAYSIDASMCTTHGIVSLNPKTQKIGHHVDWARNFPFRAFGLPDLYDPLPASVRYLGFRYDDELVAAIGEVWTGLKRAQAEIDAKATQSGRSADDLRLEAFRRYEEMSERQRTSTRSATAVAQ